MRLRLLLLFFLVNSLQAQDFSDLATKGPREDWVQPFDFSTVTPPSNPSGSVEYLLSDTQHHIEEKSNYQEWAFLIVSEAGVQDYSQLTFDFHPEYQSLRFHELQLIRDGQILDRLAQTEVQILQQEKDSNRRLYDGARSAHLIMKDVRKGDILKYAYTLKGQNPVFQNHVHRFLRLGYTSQITHCSRRVLWNPSVRTLRWHLQGPTKNIQREPSVITTNDSLHELTWEASELAKSSYQDHTPDWVTEMPWLEYSDYADWGDFGTWANGLFEVDPELPAELIAICDQLKAEAVSDEDLIVQCLRWVQRNIRYLGSFMGSHTHQPYPIETIFDRRFGDCKDQGVLTVNMLRYLSFDAAPALVNTYQWDQLTNYLPGHSAFDHLIVHLRYQDKDYWLDPTYTFQGGRLKDLDSTNLRYAFVARDGEMQLRDVEPSGILASKTTIHDDLTIHTMDGHATFQVKTVATGADANSLRRHFAKNSQDSINENYLEYYQTLYPGAKILAKVSFKDDLESNTFTTTESYEVDDIWKLVEADGDTESYRYTYISGYLLEDKLNYPDENPRTTPYSITFPKNLRHTARVKFPTDWDLEDSAETIACPAFTSHVKSSYADRVLNLDFSYRARARSIAPNEYEDYRKKMRKLLRETDYTLYPYDEDAEDAEDEASESITGYLLWGSGLTLGLLTGALAAILLYLFWNPQPRIPITRAYVGIGGWLILPAIGITLAPLWDLASLESYFSTIGEMRATFDSETEFVGWRLFYFLGGVEGGISIFLSILTIVFFYTKRSAFHSLYLGALAFGILSQSLAVFWETHLPDQEEASDSISDLIKIILQSLIWGSYMLVSMRVKATFVKRRGGNPTPPTPPPLQP